MIRGCADYFYLPHPSHDGYTGRIKSLLSHGLKRYQVAKMIKAKVKAKFFLFVKFHICERNFCHIGKRKTIPRLENRKEKSLSRDVFLKWMDIKLSIC